MHMLFIFSLILSSSAAFTQVQSNAHLSHFNKALQLRPKKAFVLPAYHAVVAIDKNNNKRCSCVFYSQKLAKDLVFDSSSVLSIRHISVQGIFDGSQQHVARIYLKNHSGYFKLKCYARRMLVEYLSDYFTILHDIELAASS